METKITIIYKGIKKEVEYPINELQLKEIFDLINDTKFSESSNLITYLNNEQEEKIHNESLFNELNENSNEKVELILKKEANPVKKSLLSNLINKYSIHRIDSFQIINQNAEFKILLEQKNEDLLQQIQKLSMDKSFLENEIEKSKKKQLDYTDIVNEIEFGKPIQIKDFTISNKNKNKKDIKNEIICQINSLIILNKELNDQLKNIELEKNKFKDELNQTYQDNSSLKSELSIKNEKQKNLGNEIIQMKSTHEKELSDQKKLLYEKIYKLNNLLEESNEIIKSYEKEITLLKNRNNKLEQNLKMLTNSHDELEKIINTNTTGLKTELDIKDQKYNDILKELSIKDIHIKSLEKLIEAQNKPIPGKIYTKIEIIPANYENDVNTKNSNEEFVKNKYDELKLNKLINGFEINNKVNQFLGNENNLKENNVNINDLVKFSGEKN